MSTTNESKTSNDQNIPKTDINDTTIPRRPWRRDPEGVSHLGRDGVLRSLNADCTVVLDVRRLSPEEIKEFAAPFDQAIRDALIGVDGRDVTDEAQLWAMPADQKKLSADPSNNKSAS